ncbi:c-C motif chemokine 14 [Camelus ferus]|nr:c-C motif chemokine 14 [Camelus ferus]
MNMLAAAVFVLCTMALCSYAQQRAYTLPTSCFSWRIPHRKVVAYLNTRSECPRPGIMTHREATGQFLDWGWGLQGAREDVPRGMKMKGPQVVKNIITHSLYNTLHDFLTRRGQEACASPTDSWVQEYIRALSGLEGS